MVRPVLAPTAFPIWPTRVPTEPSRDGKLDSAPPLDTVVLYGIALIASNEHSYFVWKRHGSKERYRSL